MLTYLEQFRMISVRLLINDPIPVTLQPKFTIVHEVGVKTDELTQQVILTVNNFCYQLGVNFHIGAVVDALSNIVGVTRVYLHRPISDYPLEYNQYMRLDVRYLKANLTLTSNTESVETVTETEGGYV